VFTRTVACRRREYTRRTVRNQPACAPVGPADGLGGLGAARTRPSGTGGLNAGRATAGPPQLSVSVGAWGPAAPSGVAWRSAGASPTRRSQSPSRCGRILAGLEAAARPRGKRTCRSLRKLRSRHCSAGSPLAGRRGGSASVGRSTNWRRNRSVAEGGIASSCSRDCGARIRRTRPIRPRQHRGWISGWTASEGSCPTRGPRMQTADI